MKKIAFFVQWMLCGGVENALIALSNKLIENGNDITIYVITEKGEFVKNIPSKVKFKTIPMAEKLRKSIPVGGTKITVRECLEKKKYIRAAEFLVKHKLNRCQFAELNIDLEKVPQLTEQYDIAVNYHIHSPFLVWYLSEKVRAGVKLTWIHNDFTTTQYDICALKQYLKCIDGFYGVSNKLVKEFIEVLPEYKDKTQVALNIVPVNEIRKKAEEFYPKEFKLVNDKVLKILTVGRLEEQKGCDIAVRVCKKMVDQELPIEWFVLGDGTQKSELEVEICKLKLEKYFHILGVKMNPYPYFKNCDIYVQPSRHEGWGLTVSEAKIFCLPIVATDFAGAKEQIVNGLSGDIADISVDSVYEKLLRLFYEPDRRHYYSENLASENVDSNDDYLRMFD